ncbi:hypothetical protein PDR89_06860 [Bacillus cereus group sp. Bc002]|uniref:hypothetical protein n=1 Tax=Bacillus cereus group sp. Bc002 TaxID=3018130 RepID=UPI0022E75023|nr:hypothetical protein [Bacillus cereus group sp. Bc002]MDA2779182.1 hypothetical protein [Bacillus cereus group sp. Bc002]
MGKVLRRKGLGGGTRLIKAEAARPECEGDGAGGLCLVGRSEATEHSSRWS